MFETEVAGCSSVRLGTAASSSDGEQKRRQGQCQAGRGRSEQFAVVEGVAVCWQGAVPKKESQPEGHEILRGNLQKRATSFDRVKDSRSSSSSEVISSPRTAMKLEHQQRRRSGSRQQRCSIGRK
ncbi:hypothetical protein NL676_025432 [Syzygium grande]|nr:hypothetical protein NL676_025432 [Syzygium grande]